jgi:hypothetical protein
VWEVGRSRIGSETTRRSRTRERNTVAGDPKVKDRGSDDEDDLGRLEDELRLFFFLCHTEGSVKMI